MSNLTMRQRGYLQYKDQGLDDPLPWEDPVTPASAEDDVDEQERCYWRYGFPHFEAAQEAREKAQSLRVLLVAAAKDGKTDGEIEEILYEHLLGEKELREVRWWEEWCKAHPPPPSRYTPPWERR